MTSLSEAIQIRQAKANTISEDFDFVRGDALATFWRQATPGTSYWRGFIPMKYLPGQVVKMELESLVAKGDGIDLPEQRGDTAIWQFLGDDQRSRIAMQMQRQGLRTVMEVDDNYLRYAPTMYGSASPWTKTHAEAVANGTMYSTEMHRKIVPHMDALIVSTRNLAEEYAEYNPNIYLCENAVDPTDWEGFEREESDVLRIGYYGAQPHQRDFPLVKKALKWAARQKDVEVVMIGFKPAGWSGRHYPWSDDLFGARKNLGKIDVGLAPITVNAWSVGKSDIKALEYAMAGVMPILQDAPPYYPWKEEADWAFVARTESDWMEQIQNVVKNRDVVKPMAAKAYGYTARLRTIQANIHHWRAAVEGT